MSPPAFQLPDFLRIAWVSDDARAIWSERIDRIRAVWPQVAIQRVRDGPGGCVIRAVPSWHVFRLQAAARRAGVSSAVLGTRGLAIPASGLGEQTPLPGRPYVYDLAFGSASEVEWASRWWDERNFTGAFELAGHPACCLAFQRETEFAGRIDPLWVIPGGEGVDCGLVRTLPPGALSAPFWRWLQLEPVMQLPCSFHCLSLAELENSWIESAIRCGFHEEMAWLTELLDWPLEWSSLHGIAEIRTPILKLCGTTDAEDRPHRLRLLGGSYPERGASGLGFPYQLRDKAARRRPLRMRSRMEYGDTAVGRLL
jgi:hypothetical protein